MGEFQINKGLQMICCNKGDWYHRDCLKQMAFQLDDFICLSCGDKDDFTHNMLANGIFIPTNSYLPHEIDNDEPRAKRRRVHKAWILEKTFENKNEAVNFIKNENCWSYHYQNKSSAGLRMNYRCNLMKFRGKQCEAVVYLFFNGSNQSVDFYRSDSQHTHNNDDSKENAVNKIS